MTVQTTTDFSMKGLNLLLHYRDQAGVWIMAYALLSARPAAIIMVMPVFARLQLTGMLLGGVTMALICPFWMPFANALMEHPMPLTYIMVIAAKESIIGIGLGVALSMPFWSMMIAGGLMDQQRGQTNLMLDQPGGGEQISATATILLIAAIVTYATSGGLESFVSTLYDSWTVWRPLDLVPSLDRSAPVLILELADAIMRRGFELALPAIFAMLLGDAAMLIIVRIAPQIHLDNVMSALRNLVFAVFLPLYLAYLIYYNHQDQIATAKAIGILKPILHPTSMGDTGMFP